MKTFTYATMFDRRYAPKGMSLIESVAKRLGSRGADASAHILALDEETFRLLMSTGPELGVRQVVRLDEAMDFVSPLGARLRVIKHDRTYQEFCWSLASVWTDHVMQQGSVRADDLLYYFDADIFFFDSPWRLSDAMEGKSVGLQPHALPNFELERLGRNGNYNIGTIAFRNDQPGRQALAWWSANVTAWCKYAEGDRDQYRYCGDQGYADGIAKHWKKDLAEFGVDVTTAPWNLAVHNITEGPRSDGIRLTNFHFHEYENPEKISNYPIPDAARKYIYAPYDESTERWRKIVGA